MMLPRQFCKKFRGAGTAVTCANILRLAADVACCGEAGVDADGRRAILRVLRVFLRGHEE